MEVIDDDDGDDGGGYVRPFLNRDVSSPGGQRGAPDSDQSDLVRSYTMTGGRAAPTVALAFEAMLQTTSLGIAVIDRTNFERRNILRLCAREILSVAEVSAKLSIPLGVVRVLAADLVTDALLDVQVATENVADDVSLILRLIEGVRAL